MFETIINLKPKSEWRTGVTIEEPQGRDGQGTAVPRLSNAWTKPIRARIDMLRLAFVRRLGSRCSAPT